MDIENAAMAAHFETEDAIGERQYSARLAQRHNASEVRSVIITGNHHVLQYTRLDLSESYWLQTMDGQHLARMVDTAHVQESIDASIAQGDNITTFVD